MISLLLPLSPFLFLLLLPSTIPFLRPLHLPTSAPSTLWSTNGNTDEYSPEEIAKTIQAADLERAEGVKQYRATAASSAASKKVLNEQLARDYLAKQKLAKQSAESPLPPPPPPLPTSPFPRGGAQTQTRPRPRPLVTLCGSGPGDPSLLTVAAHKLLTTPSNFVISDRLVPPSITALIAGPSRTARKAPGCAEDAQEEIYAWIEEGVRKGWDVVRLKIGDPYVFGRGGEEMLRIEEMFGKNNEVDFEVVPGVSAALAAPLMAGIPVTHRGASNRLIICTGYGLNATHPDSNHDIIYHPEQTLVFVMAVGRLSEIASNLISMGNYPHHTPVAVIEKAGWGAKQRTFRGDLASIAEIAKENKVVAPSTIVVGDVVNVLNS